MRIIETPVYSFAELSDEAKEKAIESCRQINVEDTDWHEFVYEGWYELLESYGFTEADIYFSGFWSQGDGACFECKYIDLQQSFKEYTLESLLEGNKVKHAAALANYIDSYCSARIITVNYHYSHERTRRIESSVNCDLPRMNAAVENFFDWLEEKRLELCRKIYKSLEESYSYLTSDPTVIEAIEANEYEFTSEGKMV